MDEILTDEEIEECREAGNRSYRSRRWSISGQQITPQDSPDWHFARAIEAAVLARVAVPPRLVQQPTMPAPQFAQWAMAVLCAEDEPRKPVSLEGRTVLALRDALAAATQAEARLPRGAQPTDADLRDVWQSVVDALPAATDEDQRIAFARAVLSIRCAEL